LIIGFSIGLAPFLSGYDHPMAIWGIFLAGIFTLIGLINSSIMSYLQATLRTEFSFIANTSGKILTCLMIGVFAFWLFPKSGDIHTETRFLLVMTAGVIGNLLMLGLTWWHAEKYIRIRFEWDPTYMKKMIKISLPYGIALFLNVIFFKVDTILLSLLTPKDAADMVVALYSLPMKIVEVGMMYGTVFLNSLLPVLTTSIEQKDSQKTTSLTRQAFQLLLLFGSSIACFLMLFSEPIIRILSSEAFIHTTYAGYSSVDVFRIVAWIFVFYCCSSLFTYILIAEGEQKKIMWMNAVIAILNLIFNIIMIPKMTFV
jgi:O-antigen/teichoic acid export membrane protein